MFESFVKHMDNLIERDWPVRSSLVFLCLILFILIAAPILQANHKSIDAYIQTSNDNSQSQQDNYNSPDVLTDAIFQMGDDVGGAVNSAGAKTVGGIMAGAAGVTDADKAAIHGTYEASVDTVNGVSSAGSFTVDTIGSGISYTGRAIGTGFDTTGHAIGNSYKFVKGMAHIGSFIRPKVNAPIPVITKIRMQQAAIIQKGTVNVSVIAPVAVGTGGACDNGNGNGGYPMLWCNSPMDSIATIPYTSEAINRECTSYAYWYFTVIEGHTDFRAWDNAKYWATTSNYPTHSVPAVGSIAVETTGVYGHVAIVQALPGQTYEGSVVPNGYVLVSEMNYDWQGHFRYSYSPLSKFSSYIYP